MALREPQSMAEVIYFTRRVIGKGSVMAWTFKGDCPQCKKAKMGKPVEKGKVKIRSTEYVCPACKHTVSKAEYEPTLTIDAKYTCPLCGKPGESSAPYKRKSVQGIQTFQVECSNCKGMINLTKKMKEGKKKGQVDLDDD